MINCNEDSWNCKLEEFHVFSTSWPILHAFVYIIRLQTVQDSRFIKFWRATNSWAKLSVCIRKFTDASYSIDTFSVASSTNSNIATNHKIRSRVIETNRCDIPTTWKKTLLVTVWSNQPSGNDFNYSRECYRRGTDRCYIYVVQWTHRLYGFIVRSQCRKERKMEARSNEWRVTSTDTCGRDEWEGGT